MPILTVQPSGKTYQAVAGSSILSALLAGGEDIAHKCEGKAECGKGSSTDCDENCAKYECENDTEHENALVENGWNLKLSQNNDEDKEVIYRERFLY